MRKKQPSIPVNPMANEFGSGIAIERIAIADLRTGGIESAQRPHREDGHSFFLLESGTVALEIDFQQYTITPSSILYIHPNQVHRILAFDKVVVSSWSITAENLNPDYLKRLEDILPAKPIALDNETFSLLAESVSLCLKFFNRTNDKFYHSLLKESCNALVALVLSQYAEQAVLADTRSRFDSIAKSFRDALERNYTTAKRPADYAEKLNISVPYLNECVKNATGYSVSYHIQQRVILEAKRLLAHSDKSVKEIATELGYDDYPYFSRLFTKVTGITALAFRSKNLD